MSENRKKEGLAGELAKMMQANLSQKPEEMDELQQRRYELDQQIEPWQEGGEEAAQQEEGADE